MFLQLLSLTEVQFNSSDTNIPILSQLDDIQVIMDDHYVKTLAMRGSAFVKPCEGKAQLLRLALQLVTDSLAADIENILILLFRC